MLLKFDAEGNQLAEVGESAIPGSAIQIFEGNNQIGGVAVDPASGDVYLAAFNFGDGIVWGDH